jgi:hypothetical protein
MSSMNCSPELQQAVEQVYVAFNLEKPPASSRKRSGLGATELFSSKALGDMTDKEIGRYATAALHDNGSAGSYRYYLPRIIELATSSSLWAGAEPHFLADKLLEVGWGDGAEDKSKAVAGAFREAFLQSLGVHPDEGRSAANWLYGAAAMGVEVAPLLTHWRFAEGATAVLHLADFVRFTARQARHDEYDVTGYWRSLSRSHRYEIATWLLDRSTYVQLDRALQQVAAQDVWRLKTALADLD